MYRSLETPHGYPLKTGLNVKNPDAPRWAAGKDGDLRDVWKKTVQGPTGEDGKSTGEPGKIFTVLGKEETVEHEVNDVSKEINAIGEYLSQHRANRVAIYVPNSLEFLVILFCKKPKALSHAVLLTSKASAFYGFTPILLTPEQSAEELSKSLKAVNADTLIAAAGSVPLQELLDDQPILKQVVWVVERTSRHVDWNEVPSGVGGKTEIAVWHDVVEDRRSSVSADLPSDREPKSIVAVLTTKTSKGEKREPVEYTQQVRHKRICIARCKRH